VSDEQPATRPTDTPVHDPRVLRGLAHPLRSRIVAEMDATGPVRAADIARDLGIPANQASFHLRQLARYGLVEEAPGAARDRRDRVWKLVADRGLSIDLQDVESVPGGPAAVGVWRRHATSWAHTVVDAAYAHEQDDETTVSITEQTLRLTRAEAEQVRDELGEVLGRWAERTRGRDDARRTYLALQFLQPYPDTGVAPDEGS
jgi:DNA-binding transcriptional ArsR family regulator